MLTREGNDECGPIVDENDFDSLCNRPNPFPDLVSL